MSSPGWASRTSVSATQRLSNDRKRRLPKPPISGLTPPCEASMRMVEPGDGFADRHGQEAGGVPGLVGGAARRRIVRRILRTPCAGSGIDAGAVDVAGDVLNDAGVDAAADFGLERDAGLLLFHDDAVHHLAVDVEA